MSAENLQGVDRVGGARGGHDGKPRPLLRLRAQIAVLGRGLAGSPEARAVLLLSLAVAAVLIAPAAAQVRLNGWNAPFYNAVAERDVGRFMHQVAVFFAIAGTLLVLNVVQAWLSLTIQLKLRAGLVHDLLDLWLAPLRAFRLAHGDRLGVNPDQRLHEDTRHLSELSTSLAIGLVQASVMLVVFAVVLWRLSAGFAIAVLGQRFVLPGYMVWAAVAYALVGSAASYRVGYTLIRFNADRYNAEARLRAALVRVSDNIGTIALQRGEGSERRFLESDLGRVLDAMRALVTATTRLPWVTAGYGWLTQVVPLLVAAPVYFSGQISAGRPCRRRRGRMHAARRAARRDRGGRARPDHGRLGRRADHRVPRARRALAVGCGAYRPARRRAVHACGAAPLLTRRPVARRAGLPQRYRAVRHGTFRGGVGEGRPR